MGDFIIEGKEALASGLVEFIMVKSKFYFDRVAIGLACGILTNLVLVIVGHLVLVIDDYLVLFIVEHIIMIIIASTIK